MKNRTFTFDAYSDPGHAWVKVPKAFLAELGIADKVTSYSYMRGSFAYLEEDCDLSLLVSALRTAGVQFKFREHVARNRRSRIRGYDCYRFESAAA